jgi:hypothetical protein
MPSRLNGFGNQPFELRRRRKCGGAFSGTWEIFTTSPVSFPVASVSALVSMSPASFTT